MTLSNSLVEQVPNTLEAVDGTKRAARPVAAAFTAAAGAGGCAAGAARPHLSISFVGGRL